MANGNQNGWNEYSRLVLKELETLADGIDNLKSEIQELRGEVSILHEKENQVKELKAWKERVDEVVSPTQLKKMSEEIEELKERVEVLESKLSKTMTELNSTITISKDGFENLFISIREIKKAIKEKENK